MDTHAQLSTKVVGGIVAVIWMDNILSGRHHLARELIGIIGRDITTPWRGQPWWWKGSYTEGKKKLFRVKNDRENKNQFSSGLRIY